MVYYKTDVASTWFPKATFTSQRIMEKSVDGEVWTFYLWTQVAIDGGITGTFRFGSSTYNTRIEDLTFTDPYEQEKQIFDLQSMDFIGFLFHPYVSIMGSTFYGLLMLVPCISIYRRTKSFQNILIMFVLFGGSTGVFTLLIPEVGMGLGWAFLVLGLAGLFYKAFR
jgi:hypothetical protein